MSASSRRSDTFAARLKYLRLEAGLSVVALAAASGISPQYLCDLEAGRRADPRLSLAARLADALGISLDALRGT